MSHRIPKKYQCKHCDYVSIAKNKKSISLHCRRKHDTYSAKEGEDFTTAELESLPKDTDVGKVPCPICKKMVNSNKLGYHKSRVHGIRGKNYKYKDPKKQKKKKENIPVIDVAGKDACITLPVILRIPIGPVNVSKQ